MDLWIPAYEALETRRRRQGSQIAFSFLRLGAENFIEPQSLTWEEVFHRCLRYALLLKKLGVRRGERVAIQGYNGVEWVLLDWACLISGVISVPLYSGTLADEMNQIFDEAEVKILFCGEKSAELSIRQLSFVEVEQGIQDLESPGSWVSMEDPDSIATIIYTSGTSGRPKGVVHSYRNISSAILTANEMATLGPRDQMFSYLPLSHVAERMLIEVGCLYCGTSVFFLDRVERLNHYLPKIRPTVFLAVPRIWDLLRFRIEKELSQNKELQKKLRFLPRFLKKTLIARALKKKLGLDRARACLSGAAKLSTETAQALDNLGIQIHEAYGLTETFCISAISQLGNPVMGSCGRIYEGVEVQIREDGEIWLKAPFHFTSYYKQPEQTAEAIEAGWFKTGDIGHLDEEGNLYVTDRKKNLFKSSGGKYVAPYVGESLLKGHPLIKEALVFGEDKAYCVALVSVESPDFRIEDLKSHLESVNSKLAHHEHIKVIGVLPWAWTAATGEMTASLKLKRKVVIEKYLKLIHQLYDTREKVLIFGRDFSAIQEGKFSAHTGL